MSSRIPQYKPRPAKAPSPDLSSIHGLFHNLGAPRFSLEELSRINQGPMTEVLDFIAEHLKGRKECAVARARLHQAENPRKTVTNVTIRARSSMDKAVSRLAQAKKTLEVYQADLKTRQDALSVNQREIETLRKTLDAKRRTALMLNVSKQKQSIRVKRLEDLTRLIDDLRKDAIAWDAKASTVIQIAGSLSISETLPPDLPRANQTRDMLTTLWANFVHISRFAASMNRTAVSNERETRLLAQIAHALRLDEQDARVAKEFQRCTALARSRARKVISDRLVHAPAAPTGLNLDNMLQSIVDKEHQITKLSQLSVALGYLCEHYMNSTSASAMSCASLMLSVDETLQDAQSYIEVLVQSVMADGAQQHALASTSSGFIDCVRRACGMRGDVSSVALLDIIKSNLHDVHAWTTFLSAALPDTLSTTSMDQEERIEPTKSNSRRAADTSVQLFQLTGAAVMTASVVQDIRVLLRERDAVGTLVGSRR